MASVKFFLFAVLAVVVMVATLADSAAFIDLPVLRGEGGGVETKSPRYYDRDDLDFFLF